MLVQARLHRLPWPLGCLLKLLQMLVRWWSSTLLLLQGPVAAEWRKRLQCSHKRFSCKLKQSPAIVLELVNKLTR